MTEKIEMKKQLVKIADIQALTGFAEIQGVVLVEENGDIFVDLVFPSQKQFFRVAHTKDAKKADRVFKSVATAVKLLSDEGFGEITIKYNREICGPEWVHVAQDDKQ